MAEEKIIPLDTDLTLRLKAHEFAMIREALALKRDAIHALLVKMEGDVFNQTNNNAENISSN